MNMLRNTQIQNVECFFITNFANQNSFEYE